MKVIVSACLLGENCKYSGGNNYNSAVAAYLKDKEIIPVCPERLAGLGVPRTPVEIVDGVLTGKDGTVVDKILRRTAEELAQDLLREGASCAVLQSRSPTCGVNQVYDGTFTGKLIPGMGVFAWALRDRGCEVIDAEDIFDRK